MLQSVGLSVVKMSTVSLDVIRFELPVILPASCGKLW